jgi:hypothetical protein
MSTSAATVLKETSILVDNGAYVIVRLPAGAVTAAAGALAQTRDPFCALMVDGYEVTLILDEDAFAEVRSRLKGAEISPRFRLITFTTPMGFEVVGFMALISRALADAGVPIMAVSAFTRDHVLVPEPHLEQAIAALERLRSG